MYHLGTRFEFTKIDDLLNLIYKKMQGINDNESKRMILMIINCEFSSMSALS
jgi:hypothetical protein